MRPDEHYGKTNKTCALEHFKDTRIIEDIINLIYVHKYHIYIIIHYASKKYLLQTLLNIKYKDIL